jgi:hypothetical protein
MTIEAIDSYLMEKINFYLKNNQEDKLMIHTLIILRNLLCDLDDDEIIEQLTIEKIDYVIDEFVNQLKQSQIFTKFEETMYYKLISITNSN